MPSPGAVTALRVLPDAEAVARHAAGTLARRIDDAREAGHEIHIALAGGTTPRRAYELLSETAKSWSHVHLWLGDERCVPGDDPESNARMVLTSLAADARSAGPPFLHHLRRPQVPEDAAWLYGLEIRERIPGLVLDMVLLGMGPDGHTASLFPGHPALAAAEAPCVAVRDAPKPPPERVTLTLPVLRRARHTLLLVTGADKREALARALDGDGSLPVALLGEGLDEIACDEAAASGGRGTVRGEGATNRLAPRPARS